MWNVGEFYWFVSCEIRGGPSKAKELKSWEEPETAWSETQSIEPGLSKLFQPPLEFSYVTALGFVWSVQWLRCF